MVDPILIEIQKLTREVEAIKNGLLLDKKGQKKVQKSLLENLESKIDETKKSSFLGFISICGSMIFISSLLVSTLAVSEKLKNNKVVKFLVDNTVLVQWAAVLSMLSYIFIHALIEWCKQPKTSLQNADIDKNERSTDPERSAFTKNNCHDEPVCELG
jgi:hypothetical protein